MHIVTKHSYISKIIVFLPHVYLEQIKNEFNRFV
jgi:hypothetical protein